MTREDSGVGEGWEEYGSHERREEREEAGAGVGKARHGRQEVRTLLVLKI